MFDSFSFSFLPFTVEIEVLIVAIEPSVNRIGFARRLTLHESAFALDDRRVDRLADEFGRDKDFDSDPSVFQLAGCLHPGAAREMRVIFQTDFTDQHSVVLDHVLVVCFLFGFQKKKERKKRRELDKKQKN